MNLICLDFNLIVSRMYKPEMVKLMYVVYNGRYY